MYRKLRYILVMVATELIDITISQEAYEKHLQKKDVISNTRLRSDNEDFFDALMSVDMTATPEGREILSVISKLN